MNRLLSFEDAPPLSVPARFFATAPLHGVLAGLLMVFEGDALFVSRWTPAALALTHLLTLGVLLQVMMGALFQFLPVAAGASIRSPKFWAGVVHPALNLGVFGLCGGFLLSHRGLLTVGALALSIAIAAFLFAALRAVLFARHTNPTIPAIKLALAGLLVTTLLGLHLWAGYVFGGPRQVEMLTALHATWGLIGWSAVLIVGVSYVVVPMFQLTPGYRARLSRYLAPGIVLLLLVWSFGRSLDERVPEQLAGLVLMLVLIAYAAVTLRLQSLSKRPRADATVCFWQTGMVCTLIAAGVSLFLRGSLVANPGGSFDGAPAFALGGLAILGALISVISGMLYKIIPFLCWMHLQGHVMANGGGKVPHMGVFLSAKATERQLFAHLASLLLAGVSLVWPQLTMLAGIALALSFVLLGANLIAALHIFRRLHSGVNKGAAA